MKTKKTNSFSRLVQDAYAEEPSPHATQRIRSVLQGELLALPHEPGKESMPEIMTPDEVIRYLRISEEQLADHIEEIHCFELAGQLRFRKAAVDEWIRDRETTFRNSLVQSRARMEVNQFSA
jgi:hypothetical protein